MATFMGDKAEYFKQFLTEEEREPIAWKRLLSDIRKSVGDASVGGVIGKFLLCLACFNALFNTSALAKVIHLMSLLQWNTMRVSMDGGDGTRGNTT